MDAEIAICPLCIGMQQYGRLLHTQAKSSIMLALAVSVHTAWPVMHGPYFTQFEVDRYVPMLTFYMHKLNT